MKKLPREGDEAGGPRDAENELDRLDYYTLLGVSETASREEIRAAFRRFALRYHPDRFAGEDGAARALQIYRRGAEAVDVLADAAQRSAYDAALATGETRLKDPGIAARGTPRTPITRPDASKLAPAPRAPPPTPPARTPPATPELSASPPPPAPTPAKAGIATFAKPTAGGQRGSVPRTQRSPKTSRRSMQAVRAAPKASTSTPRTPAPKPEAPKIKTPQARAFFERATQASASGDLRTAWRMLKAAVEAEPDNPALERELYAVERQFRP